MVRLALVLLALPAVAAADPYRAPLDWKRETGITGELGAGYGAIQTVVGHHTGLASSVRSLWIDGAIGKSAGPDVAIVLRGSISEPLDDSGPQVTAGFLGPAIRASHCPWPDGWVFTSIGMGAAFAIDNMTSDVHVGLGTDYRVGVALPTGSEHTLLLTGDFMLSKMDGGFLVTVAVGLTYQRR